MGPALHRLPLTSACYPIVVDAVVSPGGLQATSTYAADRSFNSISIDGDMSTNVSVYVLVNGAALPSDRGENRVIYEETDGEAYEILRDESALFEQDLAKLVVRVGERATKFITCYHKGTCPLSGNSFVLIK